MNVNVTLLFAIDRYEQVIGSFLRGLTARAEAGEPLSSVASVASFFLSRIDTKTDAQLPAESQLRGRVAIASARVPYQLQAQSSPAQIGSASNRSELSGVPFQLRTGKALAQSRHTVTRGFKQPARRLFRLPDDASLAARPNEISFELSEPGVIWIDFLAKQPGASMDLGAAT